MGANLMATQRFGFVGSIREYGIYCVGDSAARSIVMVGVVLEDEHAVVACSARAWGSLSAHDVGRVATDMNAGDRETGSGKPHSLPQRLEAVVGDISGVEPVVDSVCEHEYPRDAAEISDYSDI